MEPKSVDHLEDSGGRAPRWRRAEIDAALEHTRALPSEARAERRQARLNRESSETSPSPEINAALEQTPPAEAMTSRCCGASP
jgi:hypothetical protein